MKKFVLSGLACAGLLLALPDTAYAHGGQYRGPGDVVPPNPGGGGGRTPGPSGPSTPGPSGPSTPGPAGPSTPGPSGPATGGPAAPAPGAGPTTGGGIVLDDDLTRWEFWWEFNKDPFINLKAAIHQSGAISHSDSFFMGPGKVQTGKDTMKPTEAQILSEILPALHRAMEGTEQRDITSSCMIAMAKIGKDNEQIKILDVFRQRLTSKDQEIRETAALAMGLSQMTEAVGDLIEIAKDSAAGRKLCARSEIDDRTRSFAAYGLGLVGWATSNLDVKRQVFETLKGVLADTKIADRNVKVAAISAIGLLRPDASDPKGEALLADSVQALEDYYMQKLGPGEQLIQAHVPTAVAKLLENNTSEKSLEIKHRFKKMFVEDLLGKGKVKRTNDLITQSVVVALGRMAEPYDDKKSEDHEISEALLDYYKTGKDQQTQYFALMALGQIGGEENRKELLIALEKGGKALEKPWAAMSLGVLAFKQLEDMGSRATVDTGIGRALQSWLAKVKNPPTLAAIAVALGLAKFKDAADEVREMLAREKNKDDLAGYLCIGLALMDDQHSMQLIRELVETSVRRPERLQQAAIALGKLGDKSVTELLQKMMTEGDQNLAKMSAISSALGFIGDRRTIDPLKKMLFDTSLTDISRAFAAVALGGVADKEPLPWNSKIGTNMNYRASVETLTNQVNGILDIL
jgi:HEAT repeat protein